MGEGWGNRLFRGRAGAVGHVQDTGGGQQIFLRGIRPGSLCRAFFILEGRALPAAQGKADSQGFLKWEGLPAGELFITEADKVILWEGTGENYFAACRALAFWQKEQAQAAEEAPPPALPPHEEAPRIQKEEATPAEEKLEQETPLASEKAQPFIQLEAGEAEEHQEVAEKEPEPKANPTSKEEPQPSTKLEEGKAEAQQEREKQEGEASEPSLSTQSEEIGDNPACSAASPALNQIENPTEQEQSGENETPEGEIQAESGETVDKKGLEENKNGDQVEKKGKTIPKTYRVVGIRSRKRRFQTHAGEEPLHSSPNEPQLIPEAGKAEEHPTISPVVEEKPLPAEPAPETEIAPPPHGTASVLREEEAPSVSAPENPAALQENPSPAEEAPAEQEEAMPEKAQEDETELPACPAQVPAELEETMREGENGQEEEEVPSYPPLRPAGKGEAVDGLPALRWQGEAAKVRAEFERGVPFAPFAAPGWRFVRTPPLVRGTAYGALGYRAQDNGVREIAYVIPGTPHHCPGLLRGFQYRSGRKGQGYWVKQAAADGEG